MYTLYPFSPNTSEILVIRDNSYQQMYLPFDQIGKLSKLKGVVLGNLRLVTQLDNSICNWKEMRYLSINTVSFTNGTLIPECIGDGWKYLQHFTIYSLTPLSNTSSLSLPEKLFALDDMREIYLFNLKFNITFFEQLDSFSSSLLNVNFEGSNICDKYIIDGTNNTVSNTTYLDYIASISNNNILKNFIDDYKPCFTPCDNFGGFCTADMWGDGVCNTLCDTGSCGYDHCKHAYVLCCFLYVVLFCFVLCWVVIYDDYR